MEKTLPLIEQSISQIYRDSTEKMTYIIPVYQRNYAWEEDEITALIKDVYDSKQKSAGLPYYIGTLVTYNRGDNKYEVIDGQQRLTTIYIILKVLEVPNIKNELTYSARKVSASTIKTMPEYGDEVDEGIRNGYKYAKKAIDNIVGESELENFTNFFLDNIHIIHYNVPKDVDLNHYFEVMNSRGEQLEMHEIVKSKLSQHLDQKDIATFCRVWEACSKMNIYIQQAFENKIVFDDGFDNFKINSFDEIPKQTDSNATVKIRKLLRESITIIDESSSTDKSDKFLPIIDFPNFLLIVLKITLLQENKLLDSKFALDDKELINQFNEALSLYKTKDEKAVFSKSIAFNLLKAKYYLDNYMVHHSLNTQEKIGENPWDLQIYCLKDQNRRFRTLSTSKIQDELVHLLSMFEVTFTAKQRKNYLFYCMLYLFENNKPTGEDYLRFLQELADKYFYDVYLNDSIDNLNEKNQPGPNAFDKALLSNGELNLVLENVQTNYKDKFTKIYKQGCADIPLFVFNYTDYILWKKYAVELRGKETNEKTPERKKFFSELGCADFRLDTFDKFYFSRTRKSLEHYYPRAKAGEGKALSTDEINCFGNFAMIGAEMNSAGSDLDPAAKIHRYYDSKSDLVSTASLKFKIMMQKCQNNVDNKNRDHGKEWNADDIKEHQEKMLDILIK